MSTPSPEIRFVDIEFLHLDPENPRLPRSVSRHESGLLEYMGRHFNVEELMIAIGVNGYFAGEPLLAAPQGGSPGHYIVVEGNRRLAAVKLLSRPELIDKRSVQNAAAAASVRPSELPIVLFRSRDEILGYLGNRHIVGVQQWSSLSKARYLRELYDNTSGASEDEKFYRLARQIGSRRDYVKRTLISLAVYEKIEENSFFGFEGIDETTIQFSVFYSALSRIEYRNFISLDDDLSSVQHINIGALKELTEIFCVKVGSSTLLKNPQNLGKLANIISSPKALRLLREQKDLDLAHSVTSNFSSIITDLIHQAQRASESALSAMDVEALPETSAERDEITVALAHVSETVVLLTAKWTEKNHSS